MRRKLSSAGATRGSDEEVVASKPDITVGQRFKNFLAYSLERAHNPDEKFGLGSQQNHIDNVIALNNLTITAVFDPSAYTETGFISCFAEPEEAAEFLAFKRRR